MKKLGSYTALIAVIVGLNSCGNSSKTNEDSNNEQSSGVKLNQLTNNPKAEKLRLYFQIKELNQTDSSVIYLANSLYEADTVGLQIEVLKNIEPGIQSDGKPNDVSGFRKGPIKFTSVGEKSNNFVKSLGELFNLPSSGKMSSNTLLPLVFSSNQGSVDLSESKTYSFKYFFDNKTGIPAEMFGILDTYKKSFELSEKDSTFRAAIISSFEGE